MFPSRTYTPPNEFSKSLLSSNGIAASGTLSLAQASLTRIAHGGLVEALQSGQHVGSAPGGHESGLRHGQTPSTLIHPVAAEDALHMRYTDSSEIHIGSPGLAVATGTPGRVFHNIHVTAKPLNP